MIFFILAVITLIPFGIFKFIFYFCLLLIDFFSFGLCVNEKTHL
jgi:hypothetical protein